MATPKVTPCAAATMPSAATDSPSATMTSAPCRSTKWAGWM